MDPDTSIIRTRSHCGGLRLTSDQVGHAITERKTKWHKLLMFCLPKYTCVKCQIYTRSCAVTIIISEVTSLSNISLTISGSQWNPSGIPVSASQFEGSSPKLPEMCIQSALPLLAKMLLIFPALEFLIPERINTHNIRWHMMYEILGFDIQLRIN